MEQRTLWSWRFLLTAIAVCILATVTASPAAHSAGIFTNENPDTVLSNPTGGNPQFTLSGLTQIDSIRTYHYNNRRPGSPGQIWFEGGPNRAKYGPWQATLQSKYYFSVQPKIILPAGTYSVFDSNGATWSHNKASKSQGFVSIEGTPVNLNASPTFDHVKGEVRSMFHADRPAAIATLPDSRKGPVEAYFGLRPQPKLVIDKTSVSIRANETFALQVLNPLPGMRYDCLYPDNSRNSFNIPGGPVHPTQMVANHVVHYTNGQPGQVTFRLFEWMTGWNELRDTGSSVTLTLTP